MAALTSPHLIIKHRERAPRLLQPRGEPFYDRGALALILILEQVPIKPPDIIGYDC